MTRRLERPEGTLVYEIEGNRGGEGPLVVCAHGMGDLRQQFRALAPALVAAGYRVACLDLRGHGESDATFGTYAPEAVATDLLALIEAEGGPATLVANSAAAASAVWAAAERPDLVGELVLLGPVARDPGGPMAGWLQRLLGRVLAGPWGRLLWLTFYKTLYKAAPVDPAHVARIRAALTDGRRLRALWDTGTLPKNGCAARAGEVRARTIAVLGSRDPDYADPQAEALWLTEHLGAEAHVLDGVGHYPHLEQPEATAALVTAFLGDARCRAQA